MNERTFVIVKPDAVARGLIGQVISRYEAKGLQITALEMRTISAEFAGQHYAAHAKRPFFKDLVAFMTSGPLLAMIVEGPDAIEAVRTLNGVTDSLAAAPGTIRGDLSLSKQRNIVHASDSPASAAKEIQLWFPGK